MIESIIGTVKENQFLLTAFGLSGAGLITFWLKDIPLRIINFIRNRFVLSLNVESGSDVHKYALTWMDLNLKNKNYRSYLATSFWSEETRNVIIPGYGSHLFFYKRRPFIIRVSDPGPEKSGNNTGVISQSKAIVSFQTIGIKKDIINSFMKDILILKKDLLKTPMIYTRCYEDWSASIKLIPRSMESIFINKKIKDTLINRISEFYNNEQWYIDNGVPYKFGIMLYGPPGTGKTSLIKAIASYFNKSIYYLRPEELGDLSKMNVRDGLIVVEDVDTESSVHSRSSNHTKKLQKEDDPVENISLSVKLISLSEVLNSMDGMLTPHGRILIMTTNHVDKLDTALIRPGRIDLLLEIGYVNKESFGQFLDKFYPKNDINIDSINIKENLTMAQLQEYVMQNVDIEELINKVTCNVAEIAS